VDNDIDVVVTGRMNLQATGATGKGAGIEVNEVVTFVPMWLIFPYDPARLIFHQFFR
jgi:hypothetical protein